MTVQLCELFLFNVEETELNHLFEVTVLEPGSQILKTHVLTIMMLCVT